MPEPAERVAVRITTVSSSRQSSPVRKPAQQISVIPPRFVQRDDSSPAFVEQRQSVPPEAADVRSSEIQPTKPTVSQRSPSRFAPSDLLNDSSTSLEVEEVEEEKVSNSDLDGSTVAKSMSPVFIPLTVLSCLFYSPIYVDVYRFGVFFYRKTHGVRIFWTSWRKTVRVLTASVCRCVTVLRQSIDAHSGRYVTTA